jgi:hypothetical protein
VIEFEGHVFQVGRSQAAEEGRRAHAGRRAGRWRSGARVRVASNPQSVRFRQPDGRKARVRYRTARQSVPYPKIPPTTARACTSRSPVFFVLYR